MLFLGMHLMSKGPWVTGPRDSRLVSDRSIVYLDAGDASALEVVASIWRSQRMERTEFMPYARSPRWI